MEWRGGAEGKARICPLDEIPDTPRFTVINFGVAACVHIRLTLALSSHHVHFHHPPITLSLHVQNLLRPQFSQILCTVYGSGERNTSHWESNFHLFSRCFGGGGGRCTAAKHILVYFEVEKITYFTV